AVEDPGVLAQWALRVRGIVHSVGGAGLGADLTEAPHPDVVAPRQRVHDVRAAVTAGVGRVGRIVEDRYDGGPVVGGAEVDTQRGQAARVVVPISHGQIEVDGAVQGLLLQEGEDHTSPRPARPEINPVLHFLVKVAWVDDRQIDGADITWREGAHRLLIVVQGQADLFEIVDALGTPSRLAGRLHS